MTAPSQTSLIPQRSYRSDITLPGPQQRKGGGCSVLMCFRTGDVTIGLWTVTTHMSNKCRPFNLPHKLTAAASNSRESARRVSIILLSEVMFKSVLCTKFQQHVTCATQIWTLYSEQILCTTSKHMVLQWVPFSCFVYIPVDCIYFTCLLFIPAVFLFTFYSYTVSIEHP